MKKKKTTVLLCLLVTAAFLFGCAVPGESVKDVGQAAASPDAAKDTEAEKNQGTTEVTLTPAEADEAASEPAITFPPADGTDAVSSEPLEKGDVNAGKMRITKEETSGTTTVWTSASEEDFLSCLRAAAAEFPEEKVHITVHFVNGIEETPEYLSLMEARNAAADEQALREWRIQLSDLYFEYGTSRMESLQPLIDLLPFSTPSVHKTGILVCKDVAVSDIDEQFVQTITQLTAYTDVQDIVFTVGSTALETEPDIEFIYTGE